MNKRVLIILVVVVIIVVIVTISIFLQGPFETCEDGKGDDFYFEKFELLGVDNLTRFSPSNLIAHINQYCSRIVYEVKVDEKLKRVEYEEFDQFIKDYNENCNDCVLVYKVGWPYSGEIFKLSTNEVICGSGYQSGGYEGCVEISEL